MLATPLVPLKAAQLTQVVNLWNLPDTTKSELCASTCANVQFRVQRQLVDLVSKCITLSMNRDFKQSVATRKFQCIIHTCEVGMEVERTRNYTTL
jgi:hypothetical protein